MLLHVATLLSSTSALRPLHPRRAVLGAASVALAPRRGLAYDAPPGFEPAQVEGISGGKAPPGFEPSRVEGIGGGAYMLADGPGPAADVAYPPFLNGTWLCERIVTSVEGDAFQAEGAWRLLGGTGGNKRVRTVREPPSGRLLV